MWLMPDASSSVEHPVGGALIDPAERRGAEDHGRAHVSGAPEGPSLDRQIRGHAPLPHAVAAVLQAMIIAPVGPSAHHRRRFGPHAWPPVRSRLVPEARGTAKQICNNIT